MNDVDGRQNENIGIQYPGVVDQICLDAASRRAALIMMERRQWQTLGLNSWRDELLAKANSYLEWIESGYVFAQFPEIPKENPSICFFCIQRPPEQFIKWLEQLKKLLGVRNVEFSLHDVEAKNEIAL